MRKLRFYAKLAATGLVRNRQTYLPYLIASVVSIAAYYIMYAIARNPALLEMRGGAYIESFAMVGIIVLTIFCAALIFYTNSFLIKRRKKEIGLYSILGMKKGNISILMLFETVLTAVVALVAGIALGMLLARLLFLAYLRLIKIPVVFDIPISVDAIVVTCTVFLVIYALTLLANLNRVRKVNPIELMSGAKQGEREPKSSWIITLIGVATLVAGYAIALNADADPVSSIMMFLPAALLVIVATFCLFTSGSVALLKGLRKNKKYYYNKDHFISVSGMIYRMKQNAAGLASICILSCMVLVTMSATVSLYVGLDDKLDEMYPYDLSVFTADTAAKSQTLATVQHVAQQHEIVLEPGIELKYRRQYLKREEDAFWSPALHTEEGSYSLWDFGFMTLTDFNAAFGVSETLQAGQAMVIGLDDWLSLYVNGSSFEMMHAAEEYQKVLGQYVDVMVVLPSENDIRSILEPAAQAEDNSYNDYAPLTAQLLLNTDGEYQNKYAFTNALSDMTTTENFWMDARFFHEEDFYATNGGLLFLGLFLGTVFLMAAAMIIYYKQLSEGYDDRERFVIMQKVGMSEQEVKKTIGKQVRTVFYLPLVVAFVHIMVALSAIQRGLAVFDPGRQLQQFDTMLLLLATLGVVVVYALIYTVIYRRTAKTYFDLVKMT